MIELIKNLHHKRKCLEVADLAKRTLVNAFNEENAETFGQVEELRKDVSALEAQIRDMAVASFTETGDKKPTPGVGIRVGTSFDYDRADAFDWAREHGLALSLDSRAFESICKIESSRPKFVTVSESVSATIATDLSSVVVEV